MYKYQLWYSKKKITKDSPQSVVTSVVQLKVAIYGVLICVYVWPLHTSFTTTAPRFTHGDLIGYLILPIHSLRPIAIEVLMAVECSICKPLKGVDFTGKEYCLNY